jgi:hypothetical protein
MELMGFMLCFCSVPFVRCLRPLDPYLFDGPFSILSLRSLPIYSYVLRQIC